MPRAADLRPILPAEAISSATCTKQEAARDYCGGSESTFESWVRRGILPGPVPGTRRWYRKAIERALDRACGIEDQPQRPSTPLEEWRARRDRRAS
jgi:hypothetical protein